MSSGVEKGPHLHRALMKLCYFFPPASTLFLHHHGIPGLIRSSFAGPPSGSAAIVQCEGKQQL